MKKGSGRRTRGIGRSGRSQLQAWMDLIREQDFPLGAWAAGALCDVPLSPGSGHLVSGHRRLKVLRQKGGKP